MNNSPPTVRWYQRIGPSLITACVVIGPGSIMTSSTVGANERYAMLWVVAVSVAFMLLFMSLGAKLGAVADASPGTIIRRHAGWPLAWMLGLSVFFISSAYQAGNNVGVASAFEVFVESKWVVTGLLIVFNALAISFLYVFSNLYVMLERVMMVFVGLMLVSFAINLVLLKPDLGAMAAGFIPSVGRSTDMLPLLGLIGTTLVIAGAFYQAYLVRQKGWKIEDLRHGMIDARVGAFVMFLITVMLMSTAAAGLYTGQPVRLNNPVEVAQSLEVTFGPTSKFIFCFGLFSAAYSSFLINSMVGGFMAADAIGWGSKPSDLGPRVLTTVALVIGMLVGIGVQQFNFDRTPTIIAAQAVTVVAAPLVAGVLLWLTSSRAVMGKYANRPWTFAAGLIGFILMLAMAGKTAFVDLPKTVDSYRQSSTQ